MRVSISNGITVNDWQLLHRDANWVILKNSIIEKAIENSLVVKAKVNNLVVGMARIVSDKATKGILCDVIVLKDFQNLSIGSILIKEIIKRLKSTLDKDCCHMLQAIPSKNTRNFYIKNGFNNNNEISDGLFMIIENKK